LDVNPNPPKELMKFEEKCYPRLTIEGERQGSRQYFALGLDRRSLFLLRFVVIHSFCKSVAVNSQLGRGNCQIAEIPSHNFSDEASFELLLSLGEQNASIDHFHANGFQAVFESRQWFG
jgi:hypothetical protein